jgi:hypothetical protein
MLMDRQDLFYAIRSALLLTLIVVVALSVGIGLNAGVFAILNYLFLQSPTKKHVSSFVQAYPAMNPGLLALVSFRPSLPKTTTRGPVSAKPTGRKADESAKWIRLSTCDCQGGEYAATRLALGCLDGGKVAFEDSQ